ncbi:hypothetical protein J4456_02995 [Candidatus Pacearchaeota archaeon]|nr:hypothetical protein [Candidatus Pacearchaeota archaeon]
MSNVFEISDKTGRKIRLTQKQWKHIRQHHADVETEEEIAETIRKPDKHINDEREGVEYYYKFFKHKKQKSKYLKVIVKVYARNPNLLRGG